jgi:hypothetical protein
MSDRFEADVMEDLFSDQAEGASESEEFEDDGFEDMDAGEDDEFLSRIIGGIGQAVGGLMGADDFDGMSDLGDVDGADEWDDAGSTDSMDDAVADALEAEDGDEFLRRLRRVARRAVGVARQVGRGVGQVARVVGPIASAIPIPQAQAIGRIANVAGRLLADGADELEAVDELVDLAEQDDNIDAAAPVIAGLTLRRIMPAVSRLSRPARRQLVRSVSQATRTLARRQGPQAARAMPRIVQSAQRAVRQRRIPPRALPQAVRRAAARVARSPQAVRRLARPVGPAGRRGMGGLPPRGGIGAGGGMAAARANRRLRLRGPVEVIIRGA